MLTCIVADNSSRYKQRKTKRKISLCESQLNLYCKLINKLFKYKQIVSIPSKFQGQSPSHENLSENARTAIVLPSLTSSSLVSLGQLCDDGCNVSLDKAKSQVHKDSKLILEGHRNKADGLWDMPITSIQQNYQLLPSKGLYQRANKMVTHKHSIPDFMKHLNPIVQSNLSAKSNAKHHMPTSSIPPFLSSLNSLVDSNVFDNASCHKYDNKANVILR